MKIFFLGDIFGKPGRKIVKKHLPQIRDEYEVDLVIANAENLASGKGATEKTLKEMEQAGVDVFTGGNHIFHNQEIFESGRKNLIRPANFPEGTMGRGYVIINDVLVINLQGRTFIPALVDCPFRKAEQILKENPKVKASVIDFHAETTSEKAVMKFFLNGRVSAILGTHTHVATCDAQITKEGTFFVSDVGMTGPHDSAIGIEPELVLNRFLQAMPVRHKVAQGETILQGFLLDISDKKVQNFRRIEIFEE